MENLEEQSLPTISCLSKQDWLTLSFIKGVGPARLDRLFTYIHSLETSQPKIEASKLKETINLELLLRLKWPLATAQEAISYLQDGRVCDRLSEQLSSTQTWLDVSPQHHLLMRTERQYPDELRQIDVAPIFLYVTGNLKALETKKLAMVGARKASQYGLETAYKLAQQIGSLGIGLVSGGAIGIDSAAHQGALAAAGSTIVVMGSGLLHPYPKSNQALFNRILETNSGCLMSEYPLHTKVQARLFPARNRIISGLSLGVIVVEAGFKSGSLISANYALQHNRDVFAVPGRITDKSSDACLDLIKQGAKLITQVEDVINEFSQLEIMSKLSPLIPHDLKMKKKINVYPRLQEAQNNDVSRETQVEIQKIPMLYDPNNMSESAIMVLNRIDEMLLEPDGKNEFELNQLVSMTGLAIDEVMQTCMQLELEELIDPLMTGYARRLENKSK
ncbi:predicted Rossmann-fold nucleotide-binding protein involved in DNA uptake [Marinomonas sp. MED121]|uniref:DNA-processing protein DprA n=1 Tax=Marinomonas sp. MED121 TaxID=314277 RepID=UPI000068FB0F|nr:DNA-processing protein DprA [Marinomonas sp. MED121]EAQ65126.1 predicted Rossmann-fold nucleotide-binding protein involved in DNA uptake [Marinomonas sp. MED121]